MRLRNAGPRRSILSAAALIAMAILIPSSCQSMQSGDGSSTKGGAQLWAEQCSRCHNTRSPSSYSDAQWDVAVHHMRVRANLTAEESQKILEFLKSAN